MACGCDDCESMMQPYLDGTLSDGLSLEQDLFVQVFHTEDAAIGVQAFLDKTPPKFVGH